jgi:hypothetical protein
MKEILQEMRADSLEKARKFLADYIPPPDIEAEKVERMGKIMAVNKTQETKELILESIMDEIREYYSDIAVMRKGKDIFPDADELNQYCDYFIRLDMTMIENLTRELYEKQGLAGV